VTRLYLIVEGLTERAFVRQVLGPVLWRCEIFAEAILLGEAGHKGGRTNYARVRNNVLVRLKQDHSAFCSTMLDFYGLGKGFPGLPLPRNLPSLGKVARIEQAMAADVGSTIPDLRPDLRFVPYLQLHEYEGLLFSDPPSFATSIGRTDLAPQFQEIRNNFPTPEDINDDPNTAPSKRVLGLHGGYRKVDNGVDAAQSRRHRPHASGMPPLQRMDHAT